MIHATRRSLLLMLAAAPFAHAVPAASPVSAAPSPAERLAALEASSGGRLGVAVRVIDDGSSGGNGGDGGPALLYRSDERFPFCSTFKAVLAAAILARSVQEPSLLARRIRYAKEDLVSYSPETEKHLDGGMTVAALCKATLQLSDNSAANLLMTILGGPEAVTAYARSIGDTAFRLDRWETELNTCIPGDPRDTTTPAAMMGTVQRLLLGDALPAVQRRQLKAWMVGNRTGDERIRAGAPAGATVADKTGTGNYGVTNDIGVIWPKGRAPLAVVVYYAGPEQDSRARSDVIAAATKIAMDALV